MDRIYTPQPLAEEVVEQVRLKRPATIADFAAGDGELLRAARNRWADSTFIATDVNPASVALLRRNEPSWRVGQCDFLSHASRARCRALADLVGRVSLTLLNPPFTCRGGSRWDTQLNGQDVRSGLAMAFVISSIQYLARGGEMVAVLPAGCLWNERDQKAWALLRELGQVEVLAENGHNTFPGCSPRTVVVRFTNESSADSVEHSSKLEREPSEVPDLTVEVIRGRVSMFELNGNHAEVMRPLVHSTELEEGRLNLTRRKADSSYRSVGGPSVLLPRVGRPNRLKIHTYEGRRRIVISDCVIALKCKTGEEAEAVRATLLENWDEVERHYVGTGARHLTVGAISRLLEGFGFDVVAGNSSGPGRQGNE
jgi:predicted RNA methylase